MAAIGGILYLAFLVFVIAGIWKTFTKAGQPGWASIVPIYNIIVMSKIAGKPAWWIVLCIIPIVNIYGLITLFHGISTKFGKGAGFTVGLVLLGFIFFPILGFGDAVYEGHHSGSEDILDDNLAAS
jgi:hypothetical protein